MSLHRLYLPYHIFTEEVCYRAIVKMVNDEIHNQNLDLHIYTVEDIRKNLMFDLEKPGSWIIQFIDDARFHIHNNQDVEPIVLTEIDKIIHSMSECLFNVQAGEQILDKFLYKKYKGNAAFVNSYY